MFLVKNTYGVSAVIDPKVTNFKLMGTLGGSSLERKKYPKKIKDELEVLMSKALVDEEIKKVVKLRTMSQRTKSKIKKGYSASVSHAKAGIPDSLKAFLDSGLRRNDGFSYLKMNLHRIFAL